ncbi:ATP-binding protein [Streptomyces sp. P38-E01]|uniref:ATP-binding protein n=1 Tax=Streptomyces tardus TaxID=2780544 RepID=A0A949N7B4_9ACTN|nr:ATP-binding protein [Streptomyces tardus]MBU7596823.1 ATP-binding protein [Streptomyces tardus]
MLLRFRVENVRSLRDEQELSFAVPEGESGYAERLVALSDGRELALYPTLGILGGNASGKSNVLAALRLMKEAVLSSYGAWTSYDGLPREPYALDPGAAAKSCFWEADFVLGDGVRWTYGFELGESRVEGEWLHAYPKGRRQVWFDREAGRPKEFEFPGERLQDRTRLARTTRPNALLLSRAAADNHPQLGRVFDWFKKLWDIDPESERQQREAFTTRQLADGKARHRIEELLRVADLGIESTELEQRPGRPPVVKLRHTSAQGGGTIEWERESFGTRSWYALLGPVLRALDEGAVLLVDELDSSLHPRMAAEVVRLFQRPQTNPRNAQLIFTSHDSSLLGEPGGGRLLAVGQIWLTEKDADGATRVFPLSDFEPGEEEDLTSSYLTGVFGGVPRLSEGQVGRRLLMADAMEVSGS